MKKINFLLITITFATIIFTATASELLVSAGSLTKNNSQIIFLGTASGELNEYFKNGTSKTVEHVLHALKQEAQKSEITICLECAASKMLFLGAPLTEENLALNKTLPITQVFFALATKHLLSEAQVKDADGSSLNETFKRKFPRIMAMKALDNVRYSFFEESQNYNSTISILFQDLCVSFSKYDQRYFSCCPFKSLGSLDNALRTDKKFCKQFFSTNGLFEDIINKFKNDVPFKKTVTDFTTELDHDIQSIKQSLLTAPESISASISQKLREQKNRAHAYFQQYSQNSSTTLPDIFFTAIQSKKSIGGALSEMISELAAYGIEDFQKYNYLKSIEVNAKVHSKILICLDSCSIAALEDGLKKAGYSGTMVGHIPTNTINELIKIKGDIFPIDTLPKVLSAVFQNKVPKLTPDSNYKITYFNLNTSADDQKPQFDHSIVNCSVCRKQHEKVIFFLHTTDERSFCSEKCFNVTFEKRLTDELSKCLKKDTLQLTKPDKLFLERLSALYYCAYLILSNSIFQESGTFYNLPHQKIAESLQAIISSSEWDTVRRDFELSAFKIQHLKLFFSLYGSLKTKYLKGKLEKARQLKKLRYEDLDNISIPDFDHTLLKDLQSSAAKAIRESLNLSTDSSIENMARLYFVRFNELLEHLGTSQLQIAKILDVAKTLKDTDVDPELLKEIASWSVQSPEKTRSRAQSEDKALQHGLNDSETESDEEDQNFLLAAVNTETMTPGIGQKKSKIVTFDESFYNLDTYRIGLFNARPELKSLVSATDLTEAHALFKTRKNYTEASRVSLILSLAELLTQEKQATLCRDDWDNLLLHTDEAYDASLLDKLNINHLFSSRVNRYLKSHGIVEKRNNTIQVSVPGFIEESSGKRTIGFFQYSFIPESWKCIHRCFVHFSSQSISSLLRNVLLSFLKNEQIDEEYALRAIPLLEKLNMSNA